jgi:hypothetical protein
MNPCDVGEQGQCETIAEHNDADPSGRQAAMRREEGAQGRDWTGSGRLQNLNCSLQIISIYEPGNLNANVFVCRDRPNRHRETLFRPFARGFELQKKIILPIPE